MTMKRFKKFVSVMLAVVMALAMGITAFASEADENASTENTSGVTGQSYDIYQIFTGTFKDGKLISDIKWGKNGTGTEGTPVSQSILDELANTYQDNDSYEINDSAQLAVITKYVNLDSTAIISNGKDTTYTGLASGYYLVKGTVTYAGGTEKENTVETLYVVRVVENTLTFQPKVDVPKVDKKIVEGNDKVDTNEAAIGDDVNYEITGTLPSNLDAYKTYYFEFNDTLSKGLTLKEDTIKVTVNGEEVKRGEDGLYTQEVSEDNNNTTIKITIPDAKKVAGAGADIVVTYTATLNKDAIIAGDGNDNKVHLVYSNNPNKNGDGTPGSNDHPTGQTPEEQVKTYTTELAVLKTDEEGKILEGAEFTLGGNGVKVSLVTKEEFVPDENGAYWKLKNGSYTTMAPASDNSNIDDYDMDAGKFSLKKTIKPSYETDNSSTAVDTIGKDGRITFTGLGAGEYTLTETKVPDGYNAIDPIRFTITFDPETKEFRAEGISLGANNTLETTVINKKGSLLPSTGGIGTTIFYIIGGILVIGAGIILVVKKRASNE